MPNSPGIRTKLVYEDLRDRPEDGNRYELIEGDLIVTPAPSPLHQRVSKRLQRILEDFFEAGKLGEVFNAPVDVVLTNRDVVEPDLVVVHDPSLITARAIEGVPLLVVEILSHSTARIDRTRKASRYADLGIVHYWIVDPVARVIECYRLTERKYQAVAMAGQGEPLTHPDWPDLAIDTVALWADSPAGPAS